MKKKSKAVERSEVYQAYQAVFNSPNGTKVLLDLMQVHHMMSSTFNDNINQTLIREGERNAVLRILSILKIDVAGLLERIGQYEKNVE